jgi:hypothetical protein
MCFCKLGFEILAYKFCTALKAGDWSSKDRPWSYLTLHTPFKNACVTCESGRLLRQLLALGIALTAAMNGND